VIAPNGVPGPFGPGTTIIEAIDERPKDADDDPPGLPQNRKYLNAKLSSNGFMAGSYNVSGSRLVFDETSSEMCDLAALLMTRFNTFKNWTLEYSALSGPNSNSFVHWLIKPFEKLSKVNGPPLAKGWDQDGKIPF
jgi:hypothetical protein